MLEQLPPFLMTRPGEERNYSSRNLLRETINSSFILCKQHLVEEIKVKTCRRSSATIYNKELLSYLIFTLTLCIQYFHSSLLHRNYQCFRANSFLSLQCHNFNKMKNVWSGYKDELHRWKLLIFVFYVTKIDPKINLYRKWIFYRPHFSQNEWIFPQGITNNRHLKVLVS